MKKLLLIGISVLLVALLCCTAALALGGLKPTEQAAEAPVPAPTEKRVHNCYQRTVSQIIPTTDKAEAILAEVAKHKTMNATEEEYYSMAPDYLKDMDYTQARAEAVRLKAVLDNLWKEYPGSFEDRTMEQNEKLAEAGKLYYACVDYANSIAVGEELLKVRLAEMDNLITGTISLMNSMEYNCLNDEEPSKNDAETRNTINRNRALVEVFKTIVEKLKAADYPVEDKIADIETLIYYNRKENGYFATRGYANGCPDYSQELAAYLSGKSIQEIFG